MYAADKLHPPAVLFISHVKKQQNQTQDGGAVFQTARREPRARPPLLLERTTNKPAA